MEIPKSFLGYKRENGRVGTRNHVVILPVDDISNACAEAVANNIKGTFAIPHAYGRLQFGADLELFFDTMIGTGKNPNVAAVIVIGIEPKWTKKIVDAIATTGKPVEGFSIEGTGDIKTTMKASQKAQEFSQWASEKQREECPLSDLWISVKCGESDTTSGMAANPAVGNLMDKLEPLGVHLCFGETSEITGAELVCAERAKDEKIKKKFLDTWNSYNNFILENKTNDLSESQPTAGNIKGGLTTIEEKAFGNLQKIGKKVKQISEIQGQYIGLMKFQNDAINTIKSFYERCIGVFENNKINPLNQKISFQNSFMTDFLQGLIDEGVKLKAVNINNGWLELDNINDYRLYTQHNSKSSISKFFDIND